MTKIQEIEKEMKDLYPKKEVAYQDYRDNSGGNTELKNQLWGEFLVYQNRWNKLFKQRKKLLDIL